MIYFGAAVLAPILGPLLYRLLHPRPGAVRLVDGSVYLLVPILVAWQVLPHAWEHRHIEPVVAVIAGFILPALIERASHRLADQTDNLAIVVWLSGLALHALLEGAAFAGPGDIEAPFGLAVVLHRIPVGLVIWWLIRPRFGTTLAAVGVASLVVATLAGFGLGTELLGDAHGSGADLFQAFVGGTLVHVVFHQGRHDHDHDHEHHDHEHHDHDVDHER